MTLKLNIVDEVNAMLDGLPDDDLVEVVEYFKIPEKGAYMTPAVQMGLSDGKVAMFTHEGFFHLNQLDELMSVLADLGYSEDDIEIEDMREDLKHPIDNLPEITEDYFSEYDINLWEHQTQFFNKFIHVDKGIFDASTSSGKTIIAAGTAKYYEEYYPSLTVTLNEKLVNDMAKMMDKLNMDYVVINSKVPPKKRKEAIESHRHIITTRKLAINLSEEFEGFNGTYIIDELQVLGDQFYEFSTAIMGDSPIRLGLTGTLPSKSQDALKRQRLLNMVGGGVVQEVLPSYLMDKGYAAHLDVRIVKVNDTNGIRKQQEAGAAWEWPMEEAHYNKDPDRIEAIARFIRLNCPRSTLIICRPEFGFQLAAELDCDYVDGTVSSDVREEFYSRFDESDEYTLVASIGTSGVGLSIDLIHYGVMVDIGASETVFGQSIGRFMRKDNEGDKKDAAVVWDIYSNLKYGARHKRDRVKYFKRRGFTVHDKYDTITT